MLPQEIIRRKRDRETLTFQDIQHFIRGVADETVSAPQIAAFCMATFLNGMQEDERVALTMAMAQSGEIIDWSTENLDGPVLDKHSTGGVGDKVSLILAPIMAACGAYVPMISGRGLGHTGGTLDKMDAIPGCVTMQELDSLKAGVKQAGCLIVGATRDVAPADRLIYAIRDVTATVESIDLITASILSKKLAAGLEGLVMDVKYGSGAFMSDFGQAEKLAETIVRVSNGAGLNCRAVLTDMNQVLGVTAGNAIEVHEVVKFLRGDHHDQRLYDVTMAICTEMLVMGGLADTMEDAHALAQKNLDNGRAAECFIHMIVYMGGPSDILERCELLLPLAQSVCEVYAPVTGSVKAIDTRAVGMAVVELGGGRRKETDIVDHSVGLSEIAQLGDKVGPDEKPLAIIYGQDEAKITLAKTMIQDAFQIDETGADRAFAPVIGDRVSA